MGRLEYEIYPTGKENGLLIRTTLPLDYPEKWIAQVLFVPAWGNISGLYVQPAFRRLGFGKALLEYVQQIAVELSIYRVHANIYDSHVLDFFAKSGFITARTTNIYRDNVPTPLWIVVWESKSAG